MRMMPYRTIDNIIEGAVITFFDITEMKNTEDLLSKYKRESRLAAVVHDSSDAITVQDLEGQTMAWNPGAEKLYGWSEAEALKIKVSDRIPANLQSDCLDILTKLARNEILVPYQSERLSKNGDIISVWITATSLINEEGKVYAIATTERGNIKTK
jgi:two-component system CheB/CheR fusion protein